MSLCDSVIWYREMEEDECYVKDVGEAFINIFNNVSVCLQSNTLTQTKGENLSSFFPQWDLSLLK